MAENSKLEAGKIFVGGLSWDTNKETLIKYFTNYGEVADGVIMVDSVSKLPRGFGFVTFKDPNSVTKVTSVESHFLDGKKIDPKEAITKDYHSSSQINKCSSIDRKVFVGGLPHGCSVEEIKFFFGQFGSVSEVDVKMDRTTNKPRGFAFVEYEDKVHATLATTQQYHTFKDKKIEVKPAENRMPGGNASPGGSSSAYAPAYLTSSGYGGGSGTNSQNPHYAYQQFNNAFYYGYGTTSGPNYLPSAPPSYQPPSSYGPSHSSAQPNNYPSQGSSYQPNGYQQNYSQSSYPTQAFSSAYGQQAYSSASGYPQYNSSFTGQTDTTHGVPYGQSQSTSNYYQNSSYPQGYTSDSRYSQPPPNPRNF